MKKSDHTPRLIRTKDAREILGGQQVVRDCEAGRWLLPVHRRRKLTLYRFADVQHCADRIESGEYPKA